MCKGLLNLVLKKNLTYSAMGFIIQDFDDNLKLFFCPYISPVVNISRKPWHLSGFIDNITKYKKVVVLILLAKLLILLVKILIPLVECNTAERGPVTVLALLGCFQLFCFTYNCFLHQETTFIIIEEKTSSSSYTYNS